MNASEAVTGPNAVGLMDSAGAGSIAHRGLIVRGVGKTFNRNVVLDGIDLDVRPGTVVALLGENGAGKSTLSSIVAGAL